MSTATHQYRTPLDRSQLRRPSILRLTRVEMRKMIDTRAGFWLILLIAGLSVLFTGIGIFAGPDSDRTFYNFFQAQLFPVGLILPVLGILMVTTEWSQRTALATFGLVPIRTRVVAAKFLAAATYGVLSILTSLIVAAIGFGLADVLGRTATTTGSVPAAGLAGAVLFLVLNVIWGVAFGMLLMNTPAAVVLFFVLAPALSILASLIKALRVVVPWFDINSASLPLTDNSMTTKTWQHLATAGLVWIVVPMVLGSLRLVRRELK